MTSDYIYYRFMVLLSYPSGTKVVTKMMTKNHTLVQTKDNKAYHCQQSHGLGDYVTKVLSGPFIQPIGT